MAIDVEISEAELGDAPEMAEIHLAARREAMPQLRRSFTDAETRQWFAGAVGDRPAAWWVARYDGQVAGYMLLDGEKLDHLYVLPTWQRCGIGRKLLNQAKLLAPNRLALLTFQKNTKARAFYEAQGFRAVSFTEGCNEENEPDVRYVWESVG
jgi:ribosomal protein S18 acetylase RimI-like enzyme